MSKSFVKIQVSNPAEFNAISLASGWQEQCYKGSLLCMVLLPVCFYFYQYVDFWLRAPSQYFSFENIRSSVLLIACFFIVGLMFAYLVGFYRRPLNQDFVHQWLRKNESGWWLGADNHWQPIELSGEVLTTHWLVVLQFRRESPAGSRRVWLWRDAVGANTHRKLRVLLQQGH